MKELINKLYNRYLVWRFPFLRPTDRSNYDYRWTYLDDMPIGWKKAFGVKMCKEIKRALVDNDYLDEFEILQVKEKFGCYDKETEVLTKNGWKYFKDVTYDDEIATLDNDMETLIYEHPTDIIQAPYEGNMYCLQNRGVDILVTPNHNLYVAKGSYFNHKNHNTKRVYPYEFVTPDKYFGKDKRFKKGAIWQGVPVDNTFNIPGWEYTNYMKLNDCNRIYKKEDLNLDMIPFLRFLGFYIAEGCTTKKKESFSEISIAYNPYDEEELINNLIEDIGFDIHNGGKGIKRIYNVTLGTWLRENCGHLAYNKKVPQFIKNLPPEYIREFLTYLFIGDGHKTKTANILTTTSKQLSDDVQELILKCGDSFRGTFIPIEQKKSTSGIQGKHDIYTVNWLKNTEVEIYNSKSKHIKSFKEEWVSYNDMVYCVTVPNHVIYVRRNGKGYWCGNSLRFYVGSAPQAVHEIIRRYEDMSYYICCHCGKPATQISTDWICPWCDTCAEKVKKEYNLGKFKPIAEFYGR